MKWGNLRIQRLMKKKRTFKPEKQKQANFTLK